jgi:5'-methylthioadenosine phosphorylase
MVTDYDVWAEKPVSAQEVVSTLSSNVEKVRRLLEELIPSVPPERSCPCGDSLKDAVM